MRSLKRSMTFVRDFIVKEGLTDLLVRNSVVSEGLLKKGAKIYCMKLRNYDVTVNLQTNCF